ncbi:MAG: hypothetical protein JSS09_08380 [Verrucomicrobia bacterium]|nr:hypothetical protein [Verrucomicrobiota bacterium]
MKQPGKSFLYFWIIGTLSALTLLVASVCFFHTDSFSLNKIKPSRDFSFQATTSHSQKELETIRAILSQPFTPLAERDDTYVFVSKDQKHVIKFFKMKRMTPKYWLNYVPFPWLDKKRLSKIDNRERIRQEFFGGLKTAYEQFRYQNALVFLHLFRTQYLKMKATIIDTEGKTHEIPLDQVPFLLQKKADLLPEHMNNLLSLGKKEEAIRALCQILYLVQNSCQKGFSHTNENLEVEYGFIDGRAIYFRSIYLPQESSIKSPRGVLKEVFTVSKSIESWLQHNYPELVSDFQEELQDILSSLED